MQIQNRDYQDKALEMLREELVNGLSKPCLVMPTGSGKSIIIARLCKDFIENNKDARIVILAHVKELLKQNKDKLLKIYHDAKIGIFSAGLKEKIINQITIASIQSIFKYVYDLGKIDLIIIDEAHLINHKASGRYQYFIKYLLKINPKMRVVGLTATPYRTSHGYITEGESKILDTIVEPISIVELMDLGYLSKINIPKTSFVYDVSKVTITLGDYKKGELEEVVNIDENNSKAVWDIAIAGKDRKAWLIFCSGVAHAKAISELLEEIDIPCGFIHGKMSIEERDQCLKNFHSGKYRAITNANILTTGYDFPDIDLIVMLRPTKSPGLYLQMVGRGMRPKSHGGDCLLLDYAGNVIEHGLPQNVIPPSNKRQSIAEKKHKVKNCPRCTQYIDYTSKICNYCGTNVKNIKCLECQKVSFGTAKCSFCDHDFSSDLCPKCNEMPQFKNAVACNNCGYAFKSFDLTKKTAIQDIEKIYQENKEIITMNIISWDWTVKKSKNGIDMLVCNFYPLDDGYKNVSEYFCVNHEGIAGNLGKKKLRTILDKVNLLKVQYKSLYEITEHLNQRECPKSIEYILDGDFPKIKKYFW